MDRSIKMIIISQIAGTSLSDVAVNEATFTSRTGNSFELFVFDGADWTYATPGESGVANLTDYGITYTGTPVANDEIAVAHEDSEFWTFQAGNGINCVKLNKNFADLQSTTNNNENSINTIANTALKKDGSNLTASIIADFQKQTPNILSGSGTISLTDNSANFLTLTGNGVIALPPITPDQYSHTITLVVDGSNYSLDISTATGDKHLLNNIYVDPTQTYNVLFIYNKIDNSWYYSITQ